MTYKILSGTYVAAGYTLSPSYTGLTIESNATVAGTGVLVPFLATVENYGTVRTFPQGSGTGVSLTKGGTVKNAEGANIEGGTRGVSVTGGAGTVTNSGAIVATSSAVGSFGVVLTDGGSLTNGSVAEWAAEISGYNGISSTSATATTTITNFGTIQGLGGSAKNTSGAIYFDGGGTITNGTSTETRALISGSSAVSLAKKGAVDNFGTLIGVTASAVILGAGGSVTNGSTLDSVASISGFYTGVSSHALATITNFGTIAGSGPGVGLSDGGVLTNGDASDRDASIQGYSGVAIEGAVGTVTNFGTINGEGAPNGSGITTQTYVSAVGVYLADGGRLTNGSVTDRAALISGGYEGVYALKTVTVVNFGTIQSTAAIAETAGEGEPETAMQLKGGGSLTNGSLTDQAALIVGYGTGVEAPNGALAVVNFGTIESVSVTRSAGVELSDGGSVTNGANGDTRALISGYYGAALELAGVITNFGTIDGVSKSGVVLFAGGSLINGSARDGQALIDGYTGVQISGAATVTNFGTIDGFGGTAVAFGAVGDVLAVEAHSTFIGAVDGDGGTLDLASGGGIVTLAGALATVSVSMPTTAFSDFGTVEITGAASFKVSGDNTGVLAVVGGTLTSDGVVSGTGHVDINGGVADLGTGFTQAVDFVGTTGELKLGSSKTYTGAITGFSLTGTTSLDLLDIAFAGTATALYTGTTTSGVLTVTEGANTAKITLEGDYLASTFTLSAAPGGGTLVVDPPKAAVPARIVNPAPPHQFVAAMAGFGASAGRSVDASGDVWRSSPPTLVASRALA